MFWKSSAFFYNLAFFSSNYCYDSRKLIKFSNPELRSLCRLAVTQKFYNNMNKGQNGYAMLINAAFRR